VLDVLASRLGATLLLMTSALVLAGVAGVLLGVAGGRRPGSLADHALMLLGLVGYSLPVFWLGQLLLLGCSIKLDLLPTQGMRSLAFNLTPAERALDVARHLILPAVTLATRYVALNVRLTRTSLVEVSAMDYLTTARAKGLAERVVVYKHALRNALIPVVTVMGLNVGHLVAGAVLTETVFAWPGLGRLIFEAILHRDYPVMLGGLLLTSVFVVVANLLADLACALIDPRIRLEGKA
jgi:peptide/nickel transport system permease protein